MFVDITPTDSDLSPILALMSNRRPSRRLVEGVWIWGHFNAHCEIREKMIDAYALWPQLPKGREPTAEEHAAYCAAWQAHDLRHHTPSRSGVCDSLLDLIERDEYKALRDDPERRFTIVGVEVRRDEQPAEGGWRWHKWGEYIGKHEPQCEYLYDEKSIDVVWVFHVFEHA